MKRILLFFLNKAKESISLINTGVFLAIITPIAYLLGSSFHQGYSRAFGLEPNSFPVSIQDTYINSYLVLGKIFLDAGNYVAELVNLTNILRLFLIIFLLSLFFYLLFLAKRKSSDRNIGPCPCLNKIQNLLIYFNYKNNDFTKSILITLISFEIILSVIIIILIVPLSWLAVPIVGDSTGRKLAVSRLNEFKINGCHKDKKDNINTCFIIQDENGTPLHEGLLLAIDEKNIAIFKKEGLFLLPRKENYILKRKVN